MKRAIYTLFCFFILCNRAQAQACNDLAFTYTVSESRCVATGSVTISVTGGSGNYNYKAVGPVISSVTSSNTITGLAPGIYSVQVRDVTTGCIVQNDHVVINGSYNTPGFTLSKTDVSCAKNDGTITVNSVQFGRSPFSFSIVAPSPSGVGTSNTSGYFTGLIPGNYSIQLQDSCGGIQVRSITIQDYDWQINGVTVSRVGCDSADAVVHMQDNKGNTNPAFFPGFSYGVVRAAGDTVWYNSSTFRFLLNNKRSVTVVTKDPCGGVKSSVWVIPPGAQPSTGPVIVNDFTCQTFTATASGQQNLTNPQYCLYTSANLLVGCNTTGTFNLVPYGSYCLKITDRCYDTTITRCFTASQPVPDVNAVVKISNQTCSSFTATITGQTNLNNPQYCIYNDADAQISCNTTGIFTGLPYGNYCIKIKDGCYDTTIIRCFTGIRPKPVISTVNIISPYCNSFDVTITGEASSFSRKYCLYDKNGNLIICDSTGVFNGIPQGDYCIRAVSSCGDTTEPYCFVTQNPKPVVGATVKISNKTCATFTAAISGESNLTLPYYCLYDSTGTQIACDSIGVFKNIPYGPYCIKVKDGCYDTTITRCFVERRPPISVSANILQSNKTCTSFTATVSGTNLSAPTFCLYDSTGALIDCNTTGIFNNLPYAKYCATIKDGCLDTIMRICQDFNIARGVTLSTYKSCSIGSATVAAQLKSRNNPYTFTFYHPDGTILYTTTTYSDYVSTTLPVLPAGAKYKIVGVDNCGQRDSGYIAPDATIITRTLTAKSKCPGGSFENGSGDLTIKISSNLFDTKPLLIKKDGTAINQGYSTSNNYDTYTFSDLGPATYVIQYTMSQCNSTVYDTFTIKPYAFPVQNHSAIYQCDNNSFSLGADIAGGVGPYSYQIIGSEPSSPTINTAPQSTPVFNINNGTAYSLIRLRTIDACGNATLNDVSVLPLQNVVITANNTCLFKPVTLTVDTIPNAVYQWYRRTTMTDSVLIGNKVSYDIPFMDENEIGVYVCKVSVNDSCLTRITTFTLDGDSGYSPLPVSMQLSGKNRSDKNELEWSVIEGSEVSQYRIERKSASDQQFMIIGTATPSSTNPNRKYTFTDPAPETGDNLYRIKSVERNGKTTYSNIINIKSSNTTLQVYPNPVQDKFFVSISAPNPCNYQIGLLDMSGRLISTKTVYQIKTAVITNQLPANIKSGIYLLKITNTSNGAVEYFKITLAP